MKLNFGQFATFAFSSKERARGTQFAAVIGEGAQK